MATREQCEQALRERIKTRQDVDAFRQEWGGRASNLDWSDAEYVEQNIRHILDDADRKGLLNALGRKLGFTSDAEAERRRLVWVDRRSWIALVISATALIVSAIALCTTLKSCNV